MAVCVVLSLLSATIFPQATVGQVVADTGPLQAGVEFRTSSPFEAALSFAWTDNALPLTVDMVPGAEYVEPVAEAPGTPPDAEPVPYKPTPNQPDGPAIPQPRNGVVDFELRQRALTQLIVLGAVQWMVNVFDCIGFNESHWQNIRNYASGDDGWAQINDVHDSALQAQGLDPYNPEDAATYAWQLSREGTRFTPWVVHGKCGV